MVNNIETIPAQKHGTSSNMNIVNVGGLMYTPAGNRYMALYYQFYSLLELQLGADPINYVVWSRAQESEDGYGYKIREVTCIYTA